MSASPILTFSSDFGAREYYTGAVKGAILTVNPEARIVDISHEIASHDILEAAFTLCCFYSTFPPGTIHLIVVDPGVGSRRRALIAVSEPYLFVAPDNGVLSLVEERRPFSMVVSLESPQYFRHPVSTTFHARDVFGPVAAWLSRGVDPMSFGPEIEDYVKLSVPPVRKIDDHRMEGVILHIDKFGNAITNLASSRIKKLFGSDRRPAEFRVNGRVVDRHCEYYFQEKAGLAFSITGSSGYYEIAAKMESAARLLGLKRGMKVELILQPGNGG